MFFPPCTIENNVLRIVLSIVLSFGCMYSHSQIDGLVATPWPQTTTHLGLDFAPLLSYRTLHTADSDVEKAVVDTRNDLESPMYGHSFGISIQVRRFRDPFKRYQRISGLLFNGSIRYATLRYKARLSYFIPHMEEPDLPQQSKLVSTYKYIQIPLSFGFFKSVKQWTKFALIGVSPNIKTAFHQRETFFYTNGKELTREVEEDVALRPFTMSVHGAVGLEYENRFGLSYIMEPFFQYDISSTMNEDIRERLWSAGVRIGLKITM
jgi:hypothetical protein